jgi:hypothetical protein
LYALAVAIFLVVDAALFVCRCPGIESRQGVDSVGSGLRARGLPAGNETTWYRLVLMNPNEYKKHNEGRRN